MSTQLERRPLLLALIGLGIGIALRSEIFAIALVLLPLGLCRNLRSWLILSIFLVAGYVISPDPTQEISTPELVKGVLVVSSDVRHDPQGSYFIGSFSGKLFRTTTRSSIAIHRGDVLSMTARLEPSDEVRAELNREQGIAGKARIENFNVESTGPLIFRWTDGVRDRFLAFAQINSPADIAPWIEALWLRGANLPRADLDRLISSGSYTVVAASGLQVFILWGLTLFVFGRIAELDRRWQLGIAAFVLGFYCIMLGFHESTVRASLTCLAISGAFLVNREPDIISVTSLCGAIYLILNPRLAPTLGFQLSMVAPIALALFGQYGQVGSNRDNRLRLLVQHSLIATAIVFLAIEPLIVMHTGHLNFGVLVSSFLLGVTAPIVLLLTLLGFVSNMILPALAGQLMHWLVVPSVYGLRQLIDFVSGISPSLDTPPIGAFWVLVYFGIWLGIWRERARPA